MRSKRKWIIRLCVLCVVVGAPVVWFTATPIGYLLFPPSDLYTPLVLKELNLSRKGAVIEEEFINKYKGSYDLGIYVNNRLESDAKLNCQLNITISNNSGVVLENILEEQVFIFWGWEQGKGGVALLIYEAPRDLPLNENLMIRVEVLEPDLEFSKKYGPSSFFVRKMSDI